MDEHQAAALAASYKLHLHAEGKSAHTIRGYLDGLNSYVRRQAQLGQDPDFTRESVIAWVNWLLDRGVEPSSVVAWCRGPRLFSAWLLEEGERDTDPLQHLPTPRVHVKPPYAPTPDQVRLLLSTATGKEFHHLRAAAMVRMLYDSGMRVGEALSLRVDQVELRQGLVVIEKAKSGSGRVVPVGSQTTRALDRYLRSRSRRSGADHSDLFWLSIHGNPWTYHACQKELKARAVSVGLREFHVHSLRAAYAIRWTELGGSATGLLQSAGWSNASLARRYMASQGQRLAIEEHHRLRPGDL